VKKVLLFLFILVGCTETSYSRKPSEISSSSSEVESTNSSIDNDISFPEYLEEWSNTDIIELRRILGDNYIHIPVPKYKYGRYYINGNTDFVYINRDNSYKIDTEKPSCVSYENDSEDFQEDFHDKSLAKGFAFIESKNHNANNLTFKQDYYRLNVSASTAIIEIHLFYQFYPNYQNSGNSRAVVAYFRDIWV
jgi:hypothetical protein